MSPLKSVLLAAVALAGHVSCATIRVIAQAAYDNPDPFEFVPNDITARVGDVLEFHFVGPGLGVLGGNHSVAQGIFGDPCNPAPNGFFSGYFAINGTSREADNIWLLPVTSTEPTPFYCTMGTHCSRGMHGVINGAGARTFQAYRSSITTYKAGGQPLRIAGGQTVANSLQNIISTRLPGAAGSNSASLVSLGAALGLTALLVL